MPERFQVHISSQNGPFYNVRIFDTVFPDNDVERVTDEVYDYLLLYLGAGAPFYYQNILPDGNATAYTGHFDKEGALMVDNVVEFPTLLTLQSNHPKG